VNRHTIYNKRLVAVFLFGAVFLNYPLLALFNRPLSVAGFPLLYGYIFGIWMLLIICVFLIVRSGKRLNRK
jgi:hypothetical protein